MSPEQLNERFLAAAALPPELDLAEATQLFLNPPPPPKPWHHIPYLMLITTIAILLTLFLLPDTRPVPALSSFPMEVTTTLSGDVGPPSSNEAAELLINAIRDYSSTLLLASSVTPLSATPLSFPSTSTQPTTTTYPAKEKSLTRHIAAPYEFQKRRYISTTTLPPISCLASSKKETYFLQIDQHLDGRNVAYQLELQLTESELKELPKKRGTSIMIKRPAGTIEITKSRLSRRRWSVLFLANEMQRKRWNKAGYGDQHLPDDLLEAKPLLWFIDTSSPEKIADSRNLLWLLYFANNIDDEYIQLLRDAGYPDTELTDLWQLANQQLAKKDLRKLLTLNARIFKERPPLNVLPQLAAEILYGPRLLNSTNRSGITYREVLEKKPSVLLAQVPTSATLTLPSTGLFTQVAPTLPMAPDTSLRPLTPFTSMQPAGAFKLNTTGAIVDTLKITNLSLLKVKGRIRLYIDKNAPEGQVIMYKKAGNLIAVKRRSKRLIISNDCGADNVDIIVHPAGIQSFVTGKCAIMFFGEDDE